MPKPSCSERATPAATLIGPAGTWLLGGTLAKSPVLLPAYSGVSGTSASLTVREPTHSRMAETLAHTRQQLLALLIQRPARRLGSGLRRRFNRIVLRLHKRHQPIGLQLLQHVTLGFLDGCGDGGYGGAGFGGLLTGAQGG